MLLFVDPPKICAILADALPRTSTRGCEREGGDRVGESVRERVKIVVFVFCLPQQERKK